MTVVEPLHFAYKSNDSTFMSSYAYGAHHKINSFKADLKQEVMAAISSVITIIMLAIATGMIPNI